jgi:hypothetical protein
MSSRNSSGELSAYERFLLLFLGEAIVGVLLYSLFTRIPIALQMLVFAVALVVVKVDNFEPSKNKTIASLLCGFTLGFTLFCGFVSRFTQARTTLEDIWARLMMVGLCLAAVLIVLDRRL